MIAVYHWWDNPKDAKPPQNLRIPIVLSIATLRSVSDMPIHVLDMSGHPREDWGDYPEKLNFTVVPWTPVLKKHKGRFAGWKHLSRLFDLKEYVSGEVMYIDADVFWFRNPLPLSCNPEKMCFDRWNSGHFYLDTSKNKEFWEVFTAYTNAAIYSEEVRKVMQKYIGYMSWLVVWDEMMLTYMAHQHKDMFDFLPHDDHGTMMKIHKCDLNKLKMLHANGLMMSNPIGKNEGEREHSRGLICLLFKELFENINKVLSEKDIQHIFTPKELRHYLPQSMSFFTDQERILQSADKGQHYLNKILLPVNSLMI